VQSIIDSALNPAWGNNALNATRIDVPAGTHIFEGIAAPQGGLVGGGNQIFIQNVNPAWLIN
jgi:filamentous hemagglutinin